jgi:hypothetical protein
VVAFAGCTDHGGSLGDGDLDRGATYAAGGALDQKGAPLERAKGLQPVQCGHGCQSRSGGLLVAPGFGCGRPSGEHGQFRGRAGDAAQSEDTVPDAHALNVVAELVDHAHGIATADRGQVHGQYLVDGAAAHFPVDGIDAGCCDTDPDLTGAGLRLGSLLHDESAGVAVLVKACCTHAELPCSVNGSVSRYVRHAKT